MVADRSRDTGYGFELTGDPLMTQPNYEIEETTIFLDLLKNHNIVIDVGANIGRYSCLAALQGKHVLSFEPSRRNLTFLYRNLWHNKCTNTEVFPMGLGSRCGLTRVYGYGGMASFVEGWGQSISNMQNLCP